MSDAISQQFSYGGAGQGVYGEIMTPQEHSNINAFKDRVLRVLDSIPFSRKDNKLFTIGDFGTADGSVSMPILTQIIEVIRKQHGEVPIQIVHEDQPGNDFNSLFKRVHGLIPNPPSYLKRFDQVFVMASGTSFFKQVLPDSSAHLIVCFSAAHYLSELPTKFQNSFHRFPAATEEERRLVDAQAAKDWEVFLLHRAKELNTGGMLVVFSPTHDPEQKIDGVSHSVQDYEEGLLNVWRQLRDEGKITQEEFVNTNFQRCTRYLRELTGPLEDRNSAPYKAGLRLLEADTLLLPCVHQKLWQKKLDEEKVDTRASWAKAVATSHRVWTYNIFIRGLASTRSPSEKEAVVQELYNRLEQIILHKGPLKFKNGCLENLVIIRKV